MYGIIRVEVDMNKEDLKVGMKIKNTKDIRASILEVLYIGETSFFYKYKNISGKYEDISMHFSNFHHYEPTPEPPELFWRWKSNNNRYNIWSIESEYLSDDQAKETFTGKHIKATEFKPITADGKTWEGDI